MHICVSFAANGSLTQAEFGKACATHLVEDDLRRKILRGSAESPRAVFDDLQDERAALLRGIYGRRPCRERGQNTVFTSREGSSFLLRHPE
eukprot:6177263-Pleurochrysis_carterae.AAC.4